MPEFVLKDCEAAIRVSMLPYPESAWKRAKYKVWKVIYPIHPHVRDGLLAIGLNLFREKRRQRFVLGHMVPRKDIGEFLAHLERQGFGNHFIPCEDNGQIISLRRPAGFEWQYRSMIFKDGEVRAHYEPTPECFPVRHLLARGQLPRREEFLNFCGDWITPAAESAIP